MQRCPLEPKAEPTTASSAAVQVGVGQDDHVVLGAAKGLDPLAVGRGLFVDVLGHRLRSDEGDRPHLRVGQEGIHSLPRRRAPR